MPRSSKKQTLEEEIRRDSGNRFLPVIFLALLVLLGVASYVLGFSNLYAVHYDRAEAATASTSASSSLAAIPVVPAIPPLNTVAYDEKLLQIANEPVQQVSSTSSSTPAKTPLWPVKTAYPDAGALLPFNRIVAYYGNFYSTKMGVLGATPPPEMLQSLEGAVQQWQAADPSTPVIPGIDYIAVTAQGSPGADGMYRDRMPASQIDEAISLANQVHGIVILDVQVGLSTVETEVPLLKPYLEQSNVELALDPEFAMHNGAVPGSEIGSLDASDINWAANYLAGIVTANNLPPKILVVHRFTQDMVTNTEDITPLPQVQIVMDMDGWGSQAKKINTYQQFIADEPVEFTGFKLFYVNDLKPPSTGMLTPAQILKLTPQPSFIQYQ
jgi:hypothetical protein